MTEADFQQSTADALRARRVELKLTLAEVGARAEMSPQQVSNYESGRITPGVDQFVRLAKALTTTPDALLAFEVGVLS